MVEGQHFMEEHEAGVGQAQIVFRLLGDALDLPHYIVGEEAHSAGSEWRQSCNVSRLMAAEEFLHQRKDVALGLASLAILRDDNFLSAGHDGAERMDADKGIATNFFSLLDRFEQETLRLVCGETQEGSNRRFQVGSERAVQRHERMRLRQLQKLGAGGKRCLLLRHVVPVYEEHSDAGFRVYRNAVNHRVRCRPSNVNRYKSGMGYKRLLLFIEDHGYSLPEM